MAVQGNGSLSIDGVGNDGYGSKFDDDGRPKRTGISVYLAPNYIHKVNDYLFHIFCV